MDSQPASPISGKSVPTPQYCMCAVKCSRRTMTSKCYGKRSGQWTASRRHQSAAGQCRHHSTAVAAESTHSVQLTSWHSSERHNQAQFRETQPVLNPLEFPYTHLVLWCVCMCVNKAWQQELQRAQHPHCCWVDAMCLQHSCVCTSATAAPYRSVCDGEWHRGEQTVCQTGQLLVPRAGPI